ncbi:adenylosuccinate synthetase [Parasphingopyxis lamellibrachiae]|uniref:Adenylosuccinate synthetase n=1 Tax=Parasphingopyxis lamellibrachiae TaxID=680125 RepID=A0A3D9FKX7_9SPHN|nr:adenylosuccinate synthetase [Parasphingopyxis lamellibrachiae]RED17721.1 adenylosuccinate synthase [Parasphingopyxis lamellibrachiae]
MPVSIVIGGQFGSEGKGKVSLELVRMANAARVAVVRVGGPNSGHTAYDRSGQKFVLRQLPAGAVDLNVDVVFPAGSFIDLDVLQDEIELLDYPRDRIFISPYANIITHAQKAWEVDAGLVSGIGSTGSGVGAAIMASVAREAANFPLQRHDAQHCEPLEQYLCDTTAKMRQWLSDDARVVIEGTQGFGLSLYDGGYWPKATSRCTTAASALTEAGLSPIDVDEVVLVLRSFPIRVAGMSGPLPNETTWEDIAKSAGIERNIREFTTVTKNLRRVGEFDPEVVKAAIAANNPTILVLNHLDYVSASASRVEVLESLREMEQSLGRRFDYLGFSPIDMVARDANLVQI